MSPVVELLCSRRVPHAAVLALISIGFAGCSADTATRFGQNPFASQPEATASVPAPERPQFARPQPYQSQSLPPAIAAPQSYPSSGVSGGGRGIASYAPPARPIETTGTVPRSIAARNPAQNSAQISAQGTTIIVGTSDTLEILARRYNVTPAAILAANGYKGPRVLSPGQQLIIPHAGAAVATSGQAVAAARPVAASAPTSIHVVNRGDTLLGISRRYHVSVAELARVNGIESNARLRLGMKLIVPASTAAAVPSDRPATTPQPAASSPPATKLATMAGDPQQKARLAQAAPAAEDIPVETPAKAAEATGALPTFRWPVRGKVITSYGAKTNGKANDGINLAVPEGTPVKAAEDGVVAYSGNELKGYGNLVLIRHSNGYVTAYAHASELLVKRGDTIKRGQVIAKSGQSGEVGSPQLHFEIRKGSSPVDPLQFLNGA